jgi:hypothetical protein
MGVTLATTTTSSYLSPKNISIFLVGAHLAVSFIMLILTCLPEEPEYYKQGAIAAWVISFLVVLILNVTINFYLK